VTVGEALAEARYRAGLTVDELSERTRIREAVILSIEQDDYAACGGDLYVRGYVRAIAGAVGIDAQPLIRDYDAGRAAAAIATVPEPPTVIDMPPVAAEPEFTPADPEFTLADPEFVFDESEFTIADQPTAILELPNPTEAVTSASAFTTASAGTTASTVTTTSTGTTASTVTSASAVTAAKPVEPRRPSAWQARIRSRRWVTGVGILVVIALAVAGFAGSRIVAHLRSHTAGNAATAARQKSASKGAQGTGAKAPSSSATARRPKAHATQQAPSALPVHWLPIQQAMAFGPDGTADGDNPQGAQFAITSRSPLPWQTDWYTSPAFGMLKSGTGLLLDMGKAVTITSMRIDLSPHRGADLQLRLGGTPSGLRVAAHADDVGGTVRLVLASPQRARYVLIWFTVLPPDGAGTYQESVYRIVVNGRP
jgi:cytoskeletal protein RodZ